MKRFILIVLILGSMLSMNAAVTRQKLDDIGFCWDKDNLGRLMDYLKSVVPPAENQGAAIPIAGISPHDDYLYAGLEYYPLFRQVKAREIVIFGVTHKTVREKIGDPQGKLIFDNYSHWTGPIKPVEVSDLRNHIIANLDPSLYIIDNEAHSLEHSIEAEIPFLQYFNPDVKITPIMITGMDYETMESISGQLGFVLASYIKENDLKIGQDIFFLISADANHYGKDFNNTIYGEDEKAHQTGIDRDQKMVNTFLTGSMAPGKIKGLTGELWGKTYKDFKDTYWCGKYSIPFGMLTILDIVKRLNPKNELKGTLLRYSDTYSDGVLPVKKVGCGITAPFSLKHWVGFFSVAYYL